MHVKQLAQGCYVVAHRPGWEPATFRSRSRRPTLSHHARSTLLGWWQLILYMYCMFQRVVSVPVKMGARARIIFTTAHIHVTVCRNTPGVTARKVSRCYCTWCLVQIRLTLLLVRIDYLTLWEAYYSDRCLCSVDVYQLVWLSRDMIMQTQYTARKKELCIRRPSRPRTMSREFCSLYDIETADQIIRLPASRVL